MKATQRLAIALLTVSTALCGNASAGEHSGPVRIDKGTRLLLDLETALNSATTREGETVLFRARNDIKVRERTAISQGTIIKGSVIQVKPAFVNAKSQHAELHIRFEEILLIDGTGLPLSTDVLKLETEGVRSSSALVLQGILVQSLPGAALGGVLGGRQGAAAGAIAGIGLATIGNAKKPKAVGADFDLPQGSIIETRLARPLEIPDPGLLTRSLPPSPVNSMKAAPPVLAPNPVANPLPDIPTFDPDSPVDSETGASPTATNSVPVKSTGAFTVRVDVKLVQVDAVIRDRAGKPMGGLQKEDFRVFDNEIEQQIQNFSRDELPLAIALVIDRSGSVAPIMNQIQNAAFKALQHLKRGDQVALFSFAGKVELLEELTTDRQRVANRIASIQAGGGTRIIDAIDEALDYLESGAPDRRRAVILISDNVEGDSRTRRAPVVRSALEKETVVYSVRIRADSGARLPFGIPLPSVPALPSGSDPIERLARDTGGEVFDARASSLDAAMETAVTRLKLRYTLGYAPTARSFKGNYHVIEVRLADRFGGKDSNYSVLSRHGYYE